MQAKALRKGSQRDEAPDVEDHNRAAGSFVCTALRLNVCRQIHDEKGSGGKKRLMFRTKIKQEKMEEYIRHHQGVWPEVERGLRQWGVKLLTVLAVSFALSLSPSSLFRTLEYDIWRKCSQQRLCICVCARVCVRYCTRTHILVGMYAAACVCAHVHQCGSVQ